MPAQIEICKALHRAAHARGVTVTKCYSRHGLAYVTVYKVCPMILFDTNSLWPVTGVGADFDAALADACERIGATVEIV